MSTQLQPNSVNYRTFREGWTPLHWAVLAKPSHGIVSFLLKNGADPKLLTKTSRSLLALAVESHAQLDTIELLLASGVDVSGDFKSNNSVMVTPLRCAVELREEEVAVFLINSGAYIRAADCIRGVKSSLTVLQSASSSGLTVVVRLLLKHGAEQYAPQGGAPILLCLAINSGKTEVVNLLLEHSNNQGTSHDSCASWPLYIALARHDLDMVRRILRFGVVRTACSSETLTLWAAVLESNVAEVTSALKQGASLNAPTPDSPGSPSGLTSLHWAVVECQHRGYNTFTLEQYGAIVRRLLEHGADASLRDVEGKTALQRAEANGRVWAAMVSLIAKIDDHGSIECVRLQSVPSTDGRPAGMSETVSCPICNYPFEQDRKRKQATFSVYSVYAQICVDSQW
jgi:ankyrin repeat protein